MKTDGNRLKLGRVVNVLAAAFVALLFVKVCFMAIPYPEIEAFEKKPYSLPILERTGKTLQILPLADGTRREYCPLARIPDEVKDIFLQSEDKNFYFHPGVDPIALCRALWLYATRGEVVSGGSTISMQLARIVSPHQSGFAGKLAEVFDALRIEARYSKNKIFELWLANLPFGSNAVGVASASKVYFGLPLESLSPAQALMLAIIPKRPLLYNPNMNPGAVKARALLLAHRIGLPLDEADMDKALDSAKKSEAVWSWPYQAPHFVRFVADHLDATEYAKGLPVRTSLDLDLNLLIEEALNSQIEKSARNRISNGAALVVDNITGEILAYLGSENFDDPLHSGQIDGVQIRNQPGSTLKPYLYGLALDSGFTAATILPDIPSRFGGAESYVPENFAMRFSGPVRLRSALGSSLNVPAVHMLERLGVKTFVRKLGELDFISLEGYGERAGVGLAVGNLPVSLYELVQAFSVFPRNGYKNRLTFRYVLEGNVIARNPSDRVFTPATAGIIRDILSDRVSRVTGFGTHSVLNTGFTAMFKTGTSNQYNNIWALGALPRLSMGVWMGNFSGETVIGTPGSVKPAQVVVEILSHLAKTDEIFGPIEGAHQERICTLSGGRALPHCPSTILEYFAEGADPPPCTYHKKVDGQVITEYPSEFQVWAAEYGYYHESEQVPGTAGLAIVTPKNGAVFYFDPTVAADDQAIRIEVIGASECEISLSVNGSLYSRHGAPLVEFLPMERGSFEIMADNQDGEESVRFEVR
jgi:penicillin-binding protein 1C